MIWLISCINNKFKDQLIFVGDFNYTNINWYNWTASGNVKNCDERLVDVLRKKWVETAYFDTYQTEGR